MKGIYYIILIIVMDVERYMLNKYVAVIVLIQ